MKTSFRVPALGRARFAAQERSGFFLPEHAAVLVDATVEGCRRCHGAPDALEEAGPRRRIFFDPRKTRAAIVTCGGLCPGLNDVIRALTMILWYRYGVRSITGFRYGYEGLVGSFRHRSLQLTPARVEDIHQDGGTILGSSRGNQDVRVMADFLEQRRIDILFTIGGDGTQRGALELTGELRRRQRAIAVVGVPKTIDNDILYTERTFGFETAVAMSRPTLTCAHMEAKGVKNGVGLVKLMGRESGFVAAYATLSSSDVNLVLVPEVRFTLPGLHKWLTTRLRRKGHAVIVVAEGAGSDLVPAEGKDASGNVKFGDIGAFLKQSITRHFKDLRDPVAVRYIDPSYIIRSAAANPDDSVFCFQLAEHAVHAAMSGRTAMLVGLWNGHFVHIPMQKAVEQRKRIDPNSALWHSVLDNTGQPARLV